MAGWRTSAMAGALVAGLASGSRAEQPWQTVATGAVVVKTRPVTGSAVQEVWAETDLRAEVRDLQDTLLDGPSFPRFMPYTLEVRQLEPVAGDGAWLVYTRVAPPVVAHRDYVVRVRLVRSVAEDGSGVFENHWVAVAGHVPAVNGVVRITVNEGSWTVTPLEGGKSHVVYRFRIDPGGWIPPFLADIGNRSGIGDILKAVEGEARRRGEARRQEAAREPVQEKDAGH